jgi:caffeoyl-CoA O-methyltransferase
VVAPRPVTPLSILAAKLQDLRRTLQALPDIDDGLRAELRIASELASGLDPYVERCTTPESPGLRRIAERTEAADWDRGPRTGGAPVLEQEMLSGHVEGQFLQFLVHMTGARRVLEIGMFTGYSALAMAEALPEGGEVVACEVDPDAAEFARRGFDESPAGARITIEVAPAHQTLERLAAANEQFDLVFIDADKAGYAGYLKVLLGTDLLAPGAVVCVDNTLMQGLPYSSGEPTVNSEAIAAFNQSVADDPRVVQVLLPIRDGLTLIRRV